MWFIKCFYMSVIPHGLKDELKILGLLYQPQSVTVVIIVLSSNNSHFRMTVTMPTAIPMLRSPHPGLLYKAFLVTFQTTVRELIAPALEKAHLPEDPGNYCVWEAALIPGGESTRLD